MISYISCIVNDVYDAVFLWVKVKKFFDFLLQMAKSSVMIV